MKNFKINMNRPPLNEEALSPKGNFEQLLKNYNTLKMPFYKTAKFWLGTSAALVATVAVVLIYTNVIDTANDEFKFKSDSCISPPIASADIPLNTYLVNAESDSLIVHSSGSKIHIPANAFLDENGNPVKGLVEVKYREFTNPADIFLAGIPMTYDSAGEQYHFESAGMMEIAASQNGMALQTNPAAIITLDMVSLNNEDLFSTYYLDTASKKWQYLEQKNYTANAAIPNSPYDGMSLKDIQQGEKLFAANCAFCHHPVNDGVGSPLKGSLSRWTAAGDYKGKTGKEWLYTWIRNFNDAVQSGHPYAVDMANSRPSAQNIFALLNDADIDKMMAFVETADSSYQPFLALTGNNLIDNVPLESTDEQTKEVAIAKKEFVKAKESVAELEKQKPIEPRKLDNNKHRFSISVDEKEFPEMASYNNLKFQVEDKSYDALKAKVLWENVEMQRIDGSINYHITFSNAKEQYKVIATPVFEDKDYNEARKLYDDKFADYQAKLAQKKADEARLRAELEASAKAMEARIQKQIEEQEQLRKEYQARLQQSALMYRTFQVQRFGFWNCDRPCLLPKGANVIAKLVDAKTNEPLQVQLCYLVEKGRNAIFTYYPYGLVDFRFDPAKENIVWAIMNDSRIAVLKPSQFRTMQTKQGEMKLEMTVLDKKFENSEEVKEYLGI